ncbi:MAG TPA: TlpA family protein disulfide reductase [Candidatus Butyricimonas faecavium]|nr:TlpA family protein disulfide reductase [Candidatus Butyricimonas faecavium]
MKRFVCIVTVLLLVVVAKAQNYEALDKFMEKYSQNWNRRSVKQLGQPMPSYYFNKKLNSKTLEGKFVVLNFWATWCSGCRILSRDLDSVLFRNMTPYEGVQVIGVDAHENMVDKGLKAKKWWEEQRFSYPSVYGKAADACCDTVKGTHPSVLLVDDKGIIRGRWDAWSPGVAGMVKLAIWALKIVPENGIKADVATVQNLMSQKEWGQALYLLECMPEVASNAILRYKCLLEFEERCAVEYFEKIRKDYKDDPLYTDIMASVVREVVASNSQNCNFIKNGIEAIIELFYKNKGNDYRLHENMGILRCRYADCYKKQSLSYFQQSVEMAKRENKSADEIKRIEKRIEALKAEIEQKK